jgi:hypothetical protein
LKPLSILTRVVILCKPLRASVGERDSLGWE